MRKLLFALVAIGFITIEISSFVVGGELQDKSKKHMERSTKQGIDTQKGKYIAKGATEISVGQPLLIPLKSDKGYYQIGTASWYGAEFHGNKTANGEHYNMYNYTAAHKSLPLGTKVRVINLKNRKDIIVRINDRGPFIKGRIIDLSHAAAKAIGMRKDGIARVKVEVISFPI